MEHTRSLPPSSNEVHLTTTPPPTVSWRPYGETGLPASSEAIDTPCSPEVSAEVKWGA